MYMKIVKFREQRNHFIFAHLKRGRRDVSYKPANKYKIWCLAHKTSNQFEEREIKVHKSDLKIAF